MICKKMMIINDVKYPNNKLACIKTESVTHLELDEDITNDIIIKYFPKLHTFTMNVSNCKYVVFPEYVRNVVIRCLKNPYGFVFNAYDVETLKLINSYFRIDLIKKMPYLQELELHGDNILLTQKKLSMLTSLRRITINCPNTIKTFSHNSKLELLCIKYSCPNLVKFPFRNLYHLVEMQLDGVALSNSAFKDVPFLDALSLVNCPNLNDTICKYLYSISLFYLQNQPKITGQYFHCMKLLELVIDVDKNIKPQFQYDIEYLTKLT